MTINLRRLLLCGVVFAIIWSLPGRSLAVDANQEKALFSFGVIADVQWGDKEKGKRGHDYRAALDKLKECVEELNRRNLAFTIQLGDFIDGNETPEKTLSDLDKALEVYNALSMPKYHVVGNHCLRAGRKILHQKLKLSKFHYDFTIPAAKGWRFMVLYGNDAGLGALGKIQLEWFESKLAEARGNREKVIVFCHFALLKSAAKNNRMRKPQPVLKLINKSGCVMAYFAGHWHPGGYAFQDGIHHITVKGMIESPVRNAYAVIEIYPTKLKVVGYGNETTRELNLEDLKLTEKKATAQQDAEGNAVDRAP